MVYFMPTSRIVCFLLFVLFTGNPWEDAFASGYRMADTQNCTVVSQNERLNIIASSIKKTFDRNDYVEVIKMSNPALKEYYELASEMQEGLNEYVWESKEKILSYDALNLVSLVLYWQARAFLELNEIDNARESGKKLIEHFYYGQCSEEGVGFVKPAFSLYSFEEFKNL